MLKLSCVFQVKISLVDFAWKTSQSQDGQSEQCHAIYGHVYDQAIDLHKQLCGGGEDREVFIMESAGYAVKVEISDASLFSMKVMSKYHCNTSSEYPVI